MAQLASETADTFICVIACQTISLESCETLQGRNRVEPRLQRIDEQSGRETYEHRLASFSVPVNARGTG